MARPVCLFTGQWADLPLEDLAELAKGMGYDGLELAFAVGDGLGVVGRRRGDGPHVAHGARRALAASALRLHTSTL